MPKGSAVEDVESKLKAQYGSSTKEAKHKVFGTLNKIGLMHGNKPTAKGLEPAKGQRPKDKVSPRPARPAAGRPARGRGI